MADQNNSNNKSKVNGLTNHENNDGLQLGIDETLAALLASSLLSPDAENLNDISEIAGEYSSLNNTIDELNRYLDRWDERHEQLRAHIQEALRANEEDEEQTQESENNETSDSPATADSTKDDRDEPVSDAKKSGDESEKCV